VGDDLAGLLRRRGSLSLEEAATLVLQACDAIAEAHARGIVHRDLKPSNLFLTQRRNGHPCLKVLDFGISKQMEGVATADRTESGAILGSLLYMSPEQMVSPKDVDLRGDIWALGVVLYELTTGKVPFQGDSLARLLWAVLNSEPPPPSSLQPDLPAALDEVVLRCLRKRAEERYADAGELAAALRVLVGAKNEPVLVIEALAGPPREQASSAPTLDTFGLATTFPPGTSAESLRAGDLGVAMAETPGKALGSPATMGDTSAVANASVESSAIAPGGAWPWLRRRATYITAAAALVTISLVAVSSLRPTAASDPTTAPTPPTEDPSELAPANANPNAAASTVDLPAAPESTVTPVASTALLPTLTGSALPPRIDPTFRISPGAAVTRPRAASSASGGESKAQPAPPVSATESAPPPPPKRRIGDDEGVY
jgi:serine/threonine protein kinase